MLPIRLFFNSLIGKDPAEDLVRDYGLVMTVHAEMPPLYRERMDR